MKKLSQFLLLMAFPVALGAQNCAEMYDYFKKGVTLEYTNYDDKGKIQAVSTHKVTEVANIGDTLVATFNMTTVNDKGKELAQRTFPMKCHAGTIFMDMGAAVPQQNNQSASSGMEVSFRSTDQVFPGDMKVGETLPDAEMEMTMRMGSIQVLNTKYLIKNRKVEAKEDVTTPAGTFKCTKISYDFEYNFMGSHTNHTIYWYSTSVGMVKSISYDKKGKEEHRMELTKLLK